MSAPSRWTRPSLGVRIPEMTSNRVVLPGAVGTDDPEHLACIRLEAHVAERDDPPEAHADALEADHRLRRSGDLLDVGHELVPRVSIARPAPGRAPGRIVAPAAGNTTVDVLLFRRMQPTPLLTGVTVLELGDGVAGATAAGLLAQLGAEVTKIVAEPRRIADHVPVAADGRGRSHSLVASVLDRSKRVLVDIDADVDALAAASTIVIDDRVEGIDDVESHLRDVAERNRSVWLTISAYGLDGPRSGRRGGELVAEAAGGLLATIEPVGGGRPTSPPGFVALRAVGTVAALGALARRRSRPRRRPTGARRRVGPGSRGLHRRAARVRAPDLPLPGRARAADATSPHRGCSRAATAWSGSRRSRTTSGRAWWHASGNPRGRSGSRPGRRGPSTRR